MRASHLLCSPSVVHFQPKNKIKAAHKLDRDNGTLNSESLSNADDVSHAYRITIGTAVNEVKSLVRGSKWRYLFCGGLQLADTPASSQNMIRHLQTSVKGRSNKRLPVSNSAAITPVIRPCFLSSALSNCHDETFVCKCCEYISWKFSYFQDENNNSSSHLLFITCHHTMIHYMQ